MTDMTLVAYETDHGNIFFAAKRDLSNHVPLLCEFRDLEHMEKNGFPVNGTQAERKEWLREMRASDWRNFKYDKRKLKPTEDPSAARDREAMQKRPPVVQTQKPVPTPVERPLCPVGMFKVTPINAWGRS